MKKRDPEVNKEAEHFTVQVGKHERKQSLGSLCILSRPEPSGQFMSHRESRVWSSLEFLAWWESDSL